LSYKVFLSRQADRFYRKLLGDIRARVRDALLTLENEPYAGKQLHGDLRRNYSLQVGKLRIIYYIVEKDKTVYVIAICQRKVIYRQP